MCAVSVYSGGVRYSVAIRYLWQFFGGGTSILVDFAKFSVIQQRKLDA